MCGLFEFFRTTFFGGTTLSDYDEAWFRAEARRREVENLKKRRKPAYILGLKMGRHGVDKGRAFEEMCRLPSSQYDADAFEEGYTTGFKEAHPNVIVPVGRRWMV